MKGKIKILLVIPNLSAGGAERVMSYICQNLNKSKFNAALLVIGHKKDAKYTVSNTRVIYLEKSRILFSVFRLFNHIRKNNYDIVFSAISDLNNLMGMYSLFFSKTKFVGREVNISSVLKKYPESTNRKYPKFLTKIGVKYLDKIICQSDDMINDFAQLNPKLKNKLFKINNPITDDFKPKSNKLPKSCIAKLITVGSLQPRKGHDRILMALSSLDIPFHYTLIGSGFLEENLKNMVQQLNLEENVEFIPYTDEVHNYLKKSHIFLQGSYVEGFPNALLESCAVGTPVIAYNAPGGINEIIENEVNGYIVNNQEEFLTALKKVYASNSFYPQTVSDSVYKKYSKEIILSQYEDFFESLLQNYTR